MEICGFEIAKKLKEKGFREKCIAYYWEKINEHTPSFVVEDNMPEDGICLLDLLSNHNQAEWSCFIDAPTISQVLKWLRKEKKIFIHIDVYINDKFDYFFSIAEQGRETWEMVYIGEEDYKTYELAALAGIEYCLENLI